MSAVREDLFYLPLQSALSAADMRTCFRGTEQANTSQIQPVFWKQFIGDSSNASLKCLSEPEKFHPNFWPLVLYGDGGNGKTSIAMAFANRFSKEHNINPLFERAADLVRRHRDAIQTDSVADFRKRLVSAELLVIDDLHLLKDKMAIQSEVVKLMDAFLVRKKPLIVTLNELPSGTGTLIPQLASRLANGLVLPVNRPGLNARRQIAYQLAERFNIQLEDSAVDFIVDHCDFAVPRLTQLFAQLNQNSISDKTLDVEAVKGTLFGDRTHYDRDIQIITKLVSAYFELSVDEVRGKSRKQTTVLARGVCIFLCRDLLQLSFAKIGQCFGGRDHSTIIHACNNVINLLSNDKNLTLTITELRRQLTDQFLLVANS